MVHTENRREKKREQNRAIVREWLSRIKEDPTEGREEIKMQIAKYFGCSVVKVSQLVWALGIYKELNLQELMDNRDGGIN